MYGGGRGEKLPDCRLINGGTNWASATCRTGIELAGSENNSPIGNPIIKPVSMDVSMERGRGAVDTMVRRRLNERGL